ncbi:MAG: hypothetical protein WC632_06150 [Candidatus Margulisiibacteriota bacterium]
MELLITAGVLSLCTGLLLFFSGETLRRIGNVLNATVAQVDGAVMAVRMPAGILLVIAGGWIISVAFSYTELWWLHLVGAVIIFFGLLYLFLPNWLGTISRIADQMLLSTGEIGNGTRKSFGVILVLGAIYIFYALLLIR